MANTQADADDALCFLSAGELTARMRARSVSPMEVFHAFAKRIERVNHLLKAYCQLDLDRAEKEARAAEAAYMRRSATPGLLQGICVAIKDDLAVKGLRLTNGSRLNEKRVAHGDDLTVARLRAAGAVLMGKTNLPEYGHKAVTDNPLFGKTVNPWNVQRTTGGSSGGSAAAVAAGMATIALGTDIAGSIRIPASCCGVVGHKPSFGRIPRVPAGNDFLTGWVSGPLARTVADAALALQVLAGPDERDMFSLPAPEAGELDTGRPLTEAGHPLQGLRVAWCPALMGLSPEPEVETAAREALRLLEETGLVRVDDHRAALKAPIDDLKLLFRVECLVDAGIESRAQFESLRPELSETFATFLEEALRISFSDYVKAQVRVTDFVEHEAAHFFRDFDILATPTLLVPPFSKDLPLGPHEVKGVPIDPHLGWISTWAFNLTGQPAISVPCGFSDEAAGTAVPIGLQLVGKHHADGLVLRTAAAYERARPFAHLNPPV